MWVNIEFFVDARKVICLPSFAAEELKSIAHVSLGGKSVRSRVVILNNMQAEDENSYSSPLTIAMSTKLKDRLLITDTQVYKMIVTGNGIKLGPVIGFLLGSHAHVYNPDHMMKYSDRLGIYPGIGGLVYAFSYKAVDWKTKTVYGLYFNIAKGAWEYGKFPFPDVIYRRNFHMGQKSVEMLKEACEGRLFNSYRYNKFELYEIMIRDMELSEYLPQTELLESPEMLKWFIRRNKKVILKPVDLSRGRGICILEEKGREYIINDYRKSKPDEIYIRNSEELDEFIKRNPDLFTNYIMQKYIYLACVEGCFFDIRVVMNKVKADEWVHTGTECRISGMGIHVTNISRGGYALDLDTALAKAFPGEESIDGLKNEINSLCLKFCKYMDTLNEHFAEFGIDVALDRNKKLWFIEANVFPSFKGFKGMDYKTYLDIRYAPMLYALKISGFGEDSRE